jgi:hypothetical protein
MMGQYSKFIVAVIGAALIAAQTILSRGGPITSSDWLTIVTAVLYAVQVWAVPNSPKPVVSVPLLPVTGAGTSLPGK